MFYTKCSRTAIVCSSTLCTELQERDVFTHFPPSHQNPAFEATAGIRRHPAPAGLPPSTVRFSCPTRRGPPSLAAAPTAQRAAGAERGHPPLPPGTPPSTDGPASPHRGWRPEPRALTCTTPAPSRSSCQRSGARCLRRARRGAPGWPPAVLASPLSSPR